MLYAIVSPLFVRMSKKPDGKKYRINLNNFNYRKGKGYNNIKKKYCDLLADQLSHMPKIDGELRINYQLIRYYKTGKGKKDKGNVYSAIQKFFLDALVSLGHLPDDNDEIVGDEIFCKPVYVQSNERSGDDSVVFITLTTPE